MCIYTGQNTITVSSEVNGVHVFLMECWCTNSACPVGPNSPHSKGPKLQVKHFFHQHVLTEVITIASFYDTIYPLRQYSPFFGPQFFWIQRMTGISCVQILWRMEWNGEPHFKVTLIWLICTWRRARRPDSQTHNLYNYSNMQVLQASLSIGCSSISFTLLVDTLHVNGVWTSRDRRGPFW